VVGRVVQLRKAGANFVGLCPFHAEKSPSFTVSPSKQFYHCFGCGAHGSAIGFQMEHAGLSYVEAIRELAHSVGLQVPETPGPAGASERHDPGLLELLATAAKFYKQRLRDSPRAIAYLKGRGLAGETAARFAIGYAPEGWRSLQAAVPDYASPALVAAGLVIESEGEDGMRKRYDRFRDRIMFPIRNPRGQVIGFGGRVIDTGEPKYMNSPETPVFSKGRELYGLFEGRDALRETDCAIVVEGYMDVVMLAQHGVGNAVATLGTATTPDHVRKLLRLVDRVVFAFDGDAAGRRAAWRALEACLPHAADTKRLEFLFLPAEHDPDSYVRAHGLAGFEALLAEALPLSEFMVHDLSARADLSEPEGRARFLAMAKPLLQALPPAALRLQLLHRVAEVGAVTPAELDRFLGTGADRPSGAAVPERDRAGRREGPERGPGAPSRPGTGFGATRGLRPRTAPPELVRRVRLLSALHPVLAGEAVQTEFLPADLVSWLGFLRAQPPGSSLAGVCEALRTEQPERATELEHDAAADRTMLAEMTLEEARAEFEGALQQLRERSIRAALTGLASGGLQEPSERVRYQQLLELLKAS
jgi:DNA primase